ncbi:dopamine receptor D4b isoform X1 [Betta splendens]|uniref:Dopamine receptor D4b isoform X1 n=1 Tax=Betta splendens TaxID=158456 RepID=A0A9W2XNT8_BETSP|nr:dopamine receptor D4b isoform X1 [Betta splendens]
MGVCLDVCVCVHVCAWGVYVCVHGCVFVFGWVCMCVCVRAWVCVCVWMGVYVCMCACMGVCLDGCVCVCVCVCARVCVGCVRAWVRAWVCVCVWMGVYVCVHGCVSVCVCVHTCVVPGGSLVPQHAGVRRPDDHGCDAVHRVHLQPLRHQRGQVRASRHTTAEDPQTAAADWNVERVLSGLGRFIAVSVPLNYNRRHVDRRQRVLLAATWLLALAVASPVVFGINDVGGRDPRECKLEDANYVVYSSVCSFFIPCPIMVLLYVGVFRGLRRWEETRKAKLRSSIEACRKLQHAAAAGAGPGPGPLPMPLPRVIERDLAQSRMDDTDDDVQQEIPYPRQYRENSVPTVTFSQQQRRKRAKINSRERKAMRVLPVVVGCFLFCWTPFFVVHTMRAVCLTCDIPPGLMSTVTWLGYVNSALNPIIYTIFNTEFKKFFKKCFKSCC